mmetsp:Transcript_42222/g.68550  ORF Transcript_42222/g.68550 Transcript_42222/m.68550 type:complete len:206 (+) Transcript_42222:47-664(+)
MRKQQRGDSAYHRVQRNDGRESQYACNGEAGSKLKPLRLRSLKPWKLNEKGRIHHPARSHSHNQEQRHDLDAQRLALPTRRKGLPPLACVFLITHPLPPHTLFIRTDRPRPAAVAARYPGIRHIDRSSSWETAATSLVFAEWSHLDHRSGGGELAGRPLPLPFPPHPPFHPSPCVMFLFGDNDIFVVTVYIPLLQRGGQRIARAD